MPNLERFTGEITKIDFGTNHGRESGIIAMIKRDGIEEESVFPLVAEGSLKVGDPVEVVIDESSESSSIRLLNTAG